MVYSLRLTDEERELADSYARLHSMTTSEAFKRALFDKIEEEYDLAVYNDAYNDYLTSGKKSRPIADFWKELGL